MDKQIVSTLEHYERLVDENIDPSKDDPVLQSYMARWDGPVFLSLVGDLSSSRVIEVGVGTGRLACKLLERGCAHFTGIDISPKTITRAKNNLVQFKNTELVVADICEFEGERPFDLAFSVLTFMHIEEKERALAKMLASLRVGGDLVLSINLVRYTLAEGDRDWLVFGKCKVELYPVPPQQYVCWLSALQCQVAEPVPLIDTWVDPKGRKQETYGKAVATLIKAVKK